MPLESCMIIVDNSEFMRNGDYIPTRLEAQQDAANLLVGAKTQSHPESTVGVSAGTELLVSPTEDVGKLLGAVHDLEISRKGACFGLSPAAAASAANKGKKKDSADVTAAIQVASLALKHRKNKNGSQRIVLFIGSPLDGIDGKVLAKAGRQLKKNNISIDVVAMGELEANEEKLKELVDAANGRAASEEEGAERSCHLVTIPAGVLPSDVLASSPIVHGGSGGSAFAASAAAAAAGAGGDFGSTGGGANGFADFGGVDPNMDPELAMALRVSMEEERARQERLAAAAQAEAAAGTEESKDADMSDAAGSSSAAATPSAMDLGLSEEEALLQQALAMSMNENEPPKSAAEGDSKPAASMETEDDDEAAAMQLALQMSMAQAEEERGSSGDSKNNEEGKPKQQFQDPQFVNQLLGSLPGVNPNDPAIQNALKNMNKDDEKDDDRKKKDDDKKE